MKVRLNSTLATPSVSGTPGDVIRVPKAMGQRLIADGYATRLDGNVRTRRQAPAAAGRSEAAASADDTQTAGETPPDGNVDDVVAWIGGDPSRAEAALTAENESSRPRKTVIEHAEAILNGEEE